MHRFDLQHTGFPFVAGGVATGLFYLALFPTEGLLRLFFFRSWYVQAITTWLFMTAVVFVLARSRRLHDERQALATKVSVDRLDAVTPQRARDLLEVIPVEYRNLIGFRRLNELLHGYLHGGDVILLNQELSRRDIEQVETGHLVLNALRQLIPVLGFLGTVVGLSLGMAKFPEISDSGQNIDTLRSVLKDFAASLSIAFDTTLLALGYSVVVVLIASVLRHNEEAFVDEVDDKARQLIAKLRPVDAPIPSPGDSLRDRLPDLMRQFQTVVQKLDEIKEAFHSPPSYEVIVQPTMGQRRG